MSKFLLVGIILLLGGFAAEAVIFKWSYRGPDTTADYLLWNQYHGSVMAGATVVSIIGWALICIDQGYGLGTFLYACPGIFILGALVSVGSVWFSR